MGLLRGLRHTLVALLFAALTLQIAPATAAAADTGLKGSSYRDVNGVQTPTEDKTQSKLWFQDGSWWGVLYSPIAQGTSIHRLDSASQQWQDTGRVVDRRPTARADVLWDGQKLYVLSATTVVSEFSSPANPDDVAAGSSELSRYSYQPITKTYSLDPGFPATVHQGSTESTTLAKDSTGMLWSTYTRVAPDNTSQVYITHTTGSDMSWSTPVVLPGTTASTVHYDDISAVIAFQGDKVGVMWSNQLTRKIYFAVHRDGTPDSSWQTEIAYGGGVGGCSTGCANDHVSLRPLSTDGSGRVYAAVKTANRNAGQAFVELLVRDRKSAWSGYEFGAVQDLHTRPMVMIDEQHREVFMFAVSPEVGGTIYYKKSSIDDIAFAPGAGTPFIQSSADVDISNPTSTKQNVTATTGIVVLASANMHGNYWHNTMSLVGEPEPRPAAPTNLAVASPLTGADTSLQLGWADNSTNESGFAVDRKTGSGSYSQLASLPSNATSWTDAGLSAGSTYTYRVHAFNAIGSSTSSDEVSGTTAQIGPVRTFAPVADTYVDGAVPATNYGTKTFVSIDASPVQESYLKFQLTGLTGNTVQSAKLRIYNSDNGSVKGGSVAKMNNTSWGETTTTYNNRPTIDGAALQTLGAVNAATWYEFDVKPAVTGDATLSLAIKTASTDGAHYASREDSAHAPQLVVTVTAGDTTSPETTIDSGPTGTVASSSPSFAFSSSESASTFECRMDGDSFAACTSPSQYGGLPDGSHTFQVRANDAVGNTDATAASRTWTIDTTAPSSVLTSSVYEASNSSSASFSFSADEGDSTFACSLDGSPYAACVSPKSYTGLADGGHTFKVRATDAVGNQEADPPPWQWTVDTVAPDTTILTGPQGASTSATAAFTFSASETGSTFDCRLDSAAYTACTSPQQYTGLSAGSHTFTVRATDSAHNLDASPAARSWTVDTSQSDTTPPVVTLTAPAAGTAVIRQTVTLTADATDNVAVDHVDFLVNDAVVATAGSAPYSARWSSATVPDGVVTIKARATDTSSGVATSPGRSVTVDNSAPDTSIGSGPTGSVASRSASFGFSSGEPGATFECSLDGSAYASCSSPKPYTALADGAHTFRVRASDLAGNVDASAASASWTVDTVAPSTTITAGPSGTVLSRSASFGFSSNEPSAGFECSLDGSAFAGCPTPKQYSGLGDGAHTFRVRAMDAAGSVDPAPPARAWTIDPLVFGDGFELGNFSRWSVHKAINGTATVQSAVRPPTGGNFAAALTIPSSDSYAYARKTLASPQTDLTVAGDFDITAEGATSQDVSIFKLYDAVNTRLVYVNRRNVSGRIYVVYNGTTQTTTAKLALNAWARFTVRTATRGAASIVDVTMNGVSIWHTATASLGTSGISTIQIGNDKQLPFTLYADNIDARLSPVG
jgi:hypothetical protein